MISKRAIAIIFILSLILSASIKFFSLHREKMDRQKIVGEICQLVSSRAQVGSLRDVYDQAFSVLRFFTRDPNASLSLKDGGIDYNPGLQYYAAPVESLSCNIEGRQDLVIGFQFPIKKVFDFTFLYLLGGLFVALGVIFTSVKWIFSRSVLFAHREFTKSLSEIFELAPAAKSQSRISKLLSKVLLPGNTAIETVKSELAAQKKKLDEATHTQRELLGLLEKNRELELKQSAVVETISRVRHDLRSPMAYLRTHGTTLIETDDAASDVYALSLNRVDSTLSELDNFLNTQVNVAKETTLEILECLIQESVQAKRLLWKSKNLNVKFDFAEQRLSPVEIVPVQFKRALENLLQNSYEAIGGSEGTIQIAVKHENLRVILEIIDNGKGIPKDIISKLGESAITFGKKNGNGIGLRTAKSWIEKWGGSFSVKSELGSGTAITICLPLAPTEAKFIASLPIDAAEKGYVIVDDEPHMAQTLLKKTGRSGFTFDSITAYGNWLGKTDDAAEYLHVFDLHLKNGNGLDLLQNIPWSEKAILYTNDYLNETALEVAASLNVPIMPKCFV